MESPQQIFPSSEEFVSTGVCGILIYLSILAFSIHSITKGFKSKTSRRFFYSVTVMCVLELPRFFSLAIQKKYTSTSVYSLHLLASSAFFISFSIVCYQWSGLLKLGTYFKVFYGVKGLVASNLVFSLIDIVAVIVCILSPTLSSFFYSFFYEVFTFIEAVRNVIYSTFLTYYGLKLVARFWHYSNLDTLRSSSSDSKLFNQAVCKITFVLVVTSVCFALRMCMLAVKMAALYSTHIVTSSTFPVFGFWWFVCADFLPRAVPTLSFMALMRTKRLSSDQRRSLQRGDDYSNVNSEDDFQFVLLAGDEVDHTGADSTQIEAGGLSQSGWRNLDADSLFGGEDEFDDADDDAEGDVDDLFTIHLSTTSAKGNPVVEDEPVHL